MSSSLLLMAVKRRLNEPTCCQPLSWISMSRPHDWISMSRPHAWISMSRPHVWISKSGLHVWISMSVVQRWPRQFPVEDVPTETPSTLSRPDDIGHDTTAHPKVKTGCVSQNTYRHTQYESRAGCVLYQHDSSLNISI